MIKVYLAGPYSTDTVIGMLRNIREGISAATILLRRGYAVYCPWLDFQFGLQAPIGLKEYQDNSIEWLKVSDVLFLLPRWEQSKGAQRERSIAMSRGIPVVYGYAELLTRFPPTSGKEEAVEDNDPNLRSSGVREHLPGNLTEVEEDIL